MKFLLGDLTSFGGIDCVLALSMAELKLPKNLLLCNGATGKEMHEKFDDIRTGKQRSLITMDHPFAKLKEHGEHYEGDMMMPAPPASNLIVGQPELPFGILETAFNKMPPASLCHQARGLSVRGRVA